MKPPILVTWPMPERPLNLLKETAEVTVNLADRYLSAGELIARVPGKVALLCLGVDPISAPHFRSRERFENRGHLCGWV